MATRPLRVALHTVALYSCYYAFSSLSHIVELTGAPLDRMYGGHYQALTICGLTLTTITMLLALIGDLAPSLSAVRVVKKACSSVAMPAETLISILYWGLLAVNPRLLMPPKKIYDPANPGQVLRTEPIVIPFAIDACLHAYPGVFLLADYLLFSRPYPKALRPRLLCAAATVAYAAWAEHCRSINGNFVYPLLDMLSPPQRYALYAVCTLVCCFVLDVCERLHRRIRTTTM